MSTLPSLIVLLAATLSGIAAQSAWSGEAVPSAGAAPATKTPASETGAVQGWYPPPPGRGGYVQPWQQHRPVHTQRYSQPHYNPPREPYQATQPAPAAAPATAVNPLSAELKQTQKQLATRSSELKKARASLAESRASLRKNREAAKALDKKLSDITGERDALQARVAKLTTEVKTGKTTLKKHRQQLNSDQQLIRTLIADRARLRNDVANLDFRLARLLTDLQTSTDALQQAQSEPGSCDQQLSDAMALSAACRNELSEHKTRLEDRKTTLADTEQRLADVNTERDALQADLATCSQELARAKAALATTRSELKTLRTAPAAANTGAGQGAAALAQQDTTSDTDRDGVPDIIDLCPDTAQGISVETTGCAAGATINLEDVSFGNNSQELTDGAQRVLDRVAGIIKQQPDLRLEVAGHTDAAGDPSYKQWLSLQRAEAVMDYLVEQGVNPQHLTAAGYGGQQAVSNKTASGGQRTNQRIELRPLQK